MSDILLALGLVLAVEGLVWAIAPNMIEDMLRLLTQMPVEQRRLAGLAAVTAGVALVWLAKSAG